MDACENIKIIPYSCADSVSGYAKETNVKGDIFTKECYDMFSKLIGKEFYIENIKGKTTDNKEINIAPVKFKITE